MADNRLCDLLADADMRRERGHRVLEHHADSRTPDAIQLSLAQAEQIDGTEARLARCATVGGQQVPAPPETPGSFPPRTRRRRPGIRPAHRQRQIAHRVDITAREARK